MPAWKEENLRAFTDRLGKWISWSYQSDSLCEFFNPIVCLDLKNQERVKENMIILYKGKQIEILFHEVTDLQYLQGKVLPMDFAEEDSSSKKMKKSPTKEKDISTQEDVLIQKALVKVDGEDVQTNGDLGQINSLQEVVSSDSLNSVHLDQDNKFIKFRHRSGSSEICSDVPTNFEEANKSEVGKNSTNISSQSTLCSGIVRKLKVKSNRGRPRKISSKHRNPFEIGGSFKRRSKGRAKGKAIQKGKRNFAASQVLQVVPTAVVGSSVKQALEILEAAENMGLAVNGDRDVVVKEIARKLEMNEL